MDLSLWHRFNQVYTKFLNQKGYFLMKNNKTNNLTNCTPYTIPRTPLYIIYRGCTVYGTGQKYSVLLRYFLVYMAINSVK